MQHLNIGGSGSCTQLAHFFQLAIMINLDKMSFPFNFTCVPLSVFSFLGGNR